MTRLAGCSLFEVGGWARFVGRPFAAPGVEVGPPADGVRVAHADPRGPRCRGRPLAAPRVEQDPVLRRAEQPLGVPHSPADGRRRRRRVRAAFRRHGELAVL